MGMQQYVPEHFEDASEFLALLARSQGKLKKGGIPDREAAARTVLNDWNSGRIKYFTHPPETVAANISSEIVREFAAEFSLDDLEAVEENDMDTLPAVRPSELVEVAAGEMVDTAQGMVDKENMEVDGQDDVLPVMLEIQEVDKIEKRADDCDDAVSKKDPLFKIEGNQRLKKAEKMREKKDKKERKRRDKLAVGLSADMDAAFGAFTMGETAETESSDNNYSFDTDFH